MIFVLVNIVPTFIVYIAHINFILRAVVSCYKRKSSRNAHAPDDNEAFAPGSDSSGIEIGSAHAEQDKKEGE